LIAQTLTNFLKRRGPAIVLLTLSVAGSAFFSRAQTSNSTSGARGVVRLRAQFKSGSATRKLARKRFFLIKGSLEQNKALVEKIQRQPVITRDCYYAGIGASAQLANWMRENDCESVYCREIEEKDLEGLNAPPEFLAALAAGEKELKSRDLARKWLTNYLPEQLRDGFYKKQRAEIDALVSEAETKSGAKVVSVMTDRYGTAYFTDLEPGAYMLSNLVSTELETGTAIWNCDVPVKPGDLATEKPFLISNQKDKNVKCVAVETPLPSCDVYRRNDR
jgi:hypothetical protein